MQEAWEAGEAAYGEINHEESVKVSPALCHVPAIGVPIINYLEISMYRIHRNYLNTSSPIDLRIGFEVQRHETCTAGDENEAH